MWKEKSHLWTKLLKSTCRVQANDVNTIVHTSGIATIQNHQSSTWNNNWSMSRGPEDLVFPTKRQIKWIMMPWNFWAALSSVWRRAKLKVASWNRRPGIATVRNINSDDKQFCCCDWTRQSPCLEKVCAVLSLEWSHANTKVAHNKSCLRCWRTITCYRKDAKQIDAPNRCVQLMSHACNCRTNVNRRAETCHAAKSQLVKRILATSTRHHNPQPT